MRFLNDVGGGVVTKIEGKIAYVDDNGFETPMLIKDLVVVLPAGHEPKAPGAKMFDQSAYDAGRAPAPSKEIVKEPEPEPAAPAPAPETPHGDRLSVTLAFEPTDLKRLDRSQFNAVLVNDSNYTLAFTLLRRADQERAWSVVYASTVEPNELMDVASFTHETLGTIERVAIQAVAWKRDKPFELKSPIWMTKRLDLTKFHKLHCFRPGVYFDTPVLEIPVITDDVAANGREPALEALREIYDESLRQSSAPKKDTDSRKGFAAGRREAARKTADEVVEVDLHIGELTDTLAGMQPVDMLTMQLDTVRKTMRRYASQPGRKIVFIHGKGEGVLRKEVLKLLGREYPEATVQDASFREYGFGATQVTVRNPKAK